MYAEARAAIANSASDLKDRPSYCPSYSAVEAINALRDRVNSEDYPMEHVVANCMDTREHFIDEVRRERAVELSFEGFRWCDLQDHDPKDAKIGNFHREDLIARRLESKHYWFPLPDKDTYLYENFPQNPGW